MLYIHNMLLSGEPANIIYQENEAHWLIVVTDFEAFNFSLTVLSDLPQPFVMMGLLASCIKSLTPVLLLRLSHLGIWGQHLRLLQDNLIDPSGRCVQS